MSELTIHTGTQLDYTIINIDWFNENNVRQKDVIELVIQKQDKPRTLEVRLNDVTIATISSDRR